MARFYDSPGQPNLPFDVQGGTNGTQPTFSGPAFTSYYTKIGNTVTFMHYVDFSNITSFGTGQYYMTVPFAPAMDITFRSGALLDSVNNREYHMSGTVREGQTTMWLFTTDISGQRLFDYPFTSTVPYALNSNDHFHISGTYLSQ